MTAEQEHPSAECPACGSTKLHASRRRSTFEKLTAVVGIAYFRCHECKLRFSAYVGGFASHSMRGDYLLVKQRTKEIVVAGVLLAIIVAVLVWVLYHAGEG